MVIALAAIFALLAPDSDEAIAGKPPTEAAATQRPCPSPVPKASGDVHAVFGYELRSQPILHFLTALVAATEAEQRQVVDAAVIANSSKAYAEVLHATSKLCPSSDALNGSSRAYYIVASEWKGRNDVQARQSGVFFNVLSTAISTLANGEGLTSEQQSEAVSPFPIGWTSTPKAVLPPNGACAQPDSPANTIRVAQPVYPPVAIATRTTGIVDVLVSLDENGYARSVQVVKSTMHDSIGARAIEQESIVAAAATTYAPDVVRCRPVAGHYVFTSDFLGK